MGKEIKSTQQKSKTPSRYVQKHHLDDLIIGYKNGGVQTRKRKMEDPPKEVNFALLSQVEPSSFKEARAKIYWVKDMNEEIYHVENNQMWELVPRSKDNIGTK